jgi:hypothetical protein
VLGAAVVAAVDGEGDALVQEAQLGGVLAALQFVRAAKKALKQRLVVGMQLVRPREHLVVGAVQQIVFQ